jgi:hypothetical protein
MERFTFDFLRFGLCTGKEGLVPCNSACNRCFSSTLRLSDGRGLLRVNSFVSLPVVSFMDVAPDIVPDARARRLELDVSIFQGDVTRLALYTDDTVGA